MDNQDTREILPVETKEIRANSSITINLGNYNSAKIEFGLTKSINDPSKIDLQQEIQLLWQQVNDEVDNQINIISNSFKK